MATRRCERRVRLAAGLGAVLALTIGAPAFAQTESRYSWIVQPPPGPAPAEATALVAGCPDCDDVPLAISCAPGRREVTITSQVAVPNGEEGGLAEVVFEIDRDAFRRDARLQRNELVGGLTPVAVVDRNDILLAAISAGKMLTVALGPSRLDIPLRGSADALRRMRAACEGTGAPAVVAPATGAQQQTGGAPALEAPAAGGDAPAAPLDPSPPFILDLPAN